MRSLLHFRYLRENDVVLVLALSASHAQDVSRFLSQVLKLNVVFHRSRTHVQHSSSRRLQFYSCDR